MSAGARAIPSLRILFCSVVRLSPKSSAAPPCPEIFPRAVLRASTIAWRSASSKVEPGCADCRGSLQLLQWNPELAALRQYHRSFNEIFQFADIAGPGSIG